MSDFETKQKTMLALVELRGSYPDYCFTSRVYNDWPTNDLSWEENCLIFIQNSIGGLWDPFIAKDKYNEIKRHLERIKLRGLPEKDI